MERVILFDGECNFCNASVQFILKRDPKAYFKFSSLQGAFGERLRREKDFPEGLDSFVYVEGERIFTKSTAALKVCKQISGFWKLFYIFLLIPKPLRDMVYDFVARNRYKWFGKRDACMVPSPEQRSRFLD